MTNNENCRQIVLNVPKQRQLSTYYTGFVNEEHFRQVFWTNEIERRNDDQIKLDMQSRLAYQICTIFYNILRFTETEEHGLFQPPVSFNPLRTTGFLRKLQNMSKLTQNWVNHKSDCTIWKHSPRPFKWIPTSGGSNVMWKFLLISTSESWCPK